MKKKRGIIFGIVMVAVLTIVGAVYFIITRPQIIDPSDKVVLSDQAILTRVLPPSLATNVHIVKEMKESGENGYIVKGTITSEELTRVPFGGGNIPAELADKYGSGLGTDFMVYDMNVAEVWFGDVEGETFTFKIMGDKNSVITKPNVGDDVILFAYLTEGMDVPQLVDLEHSIFTDNGSLYSFSNTEILSAYDTKSDRVLKADIEELMEKDTEELFNMAMEPR